MSLVFKTPKSTLNTTSKAIQNLGGDCPPCPEPVLESASEEYTSNGEYTITPEQGVDGFSSVDITVNVPSDVNNQNKTVSPTTSSQTVEADSGYSGLGTVTVNAVTSAIDQNIAAGNIKKDVSILGVTGNYDPQPTLSNLNITPSTNSQEYNPAISGVDGYSLVRVNAVTSAIDQNITARNIKNGVSILGVTGNVDEANFEPDKEFLGDVTGTYLITPQSGYNGFEEVKVTVDPNPIGSFWNPFDVVEQTVMADVYNKLDEGGYFDGMSAFFCMGVESGSIDSETGYYIAEDANGNSFAIGPYLENPDYDPEQEEDPIDNPQLIFPENFDLSGLSVQVEAVFDDVIVTENEPEDPMEAPTYTVEISVCSFSGINWNSDPESWPLYWDGTLSGSIEASTRNLSLSTNELSQMSIASPEPWEIEIDQPQSQMNVSPLTKSGLRSAAPTLEIDQTEGNAGVFTLNVLSTEDQNTGFTIRGLNSGNELHIDVESLGNYFTIESLEDNNTIAWFSFDDEHTLEYSLDNGETWDVTELEINPGTSDYIWTTTIDEGDVVLFRGNNETFYKSNSQWCGFSSNRTVNVSGYLTSLLESDNFVTYTLSAPSVFFKHFQNLKVVDASGLILPSNASYRCYCNMFYNCWTLTTPPEILPATTLTESCYAGMFANCTSLTSAPELPATVLANYCYQGMFENCTSLEEAPMINAKYLSMYCYDSMFENCTSLETAPELPVLGLESYCFNEMFKGCTSLTSAPELPITTLKERCYKSMFEGCTSLTEAPELPAETLVNQCYMNMFKGCTSLESVTCLATNISASSCVYDWLNGVAAEGTFYKDENMTGWTVGTNVPTGWTVEDYVA